MMSPMEEGWIVFCEASHLDADNNEIGRLFWMLGAYFMFQLLAEASETEIERMALSIEAGFDQFRDDVEGLSTSRSATN